MKSDEYDSPVFVAAYRNTPYGSPLASSASASSASVYSDASQSSDDTTNTSVSFEQDSCDSYCYSQLSVSQPNRSSCEQGASLTKSWAKQQTQPAQVEVPSELRQNPRRTSSSATSRPGCPPTLVKQAERKLTFVDNLVDSSTQIVEAIWPTSSVVYRNDAVNSPVLPLRTFIQETLRRSRTSYSTLQVALYYLVLVKPHVPDHDFTMEQVDDCHASRALQCGRRMFLAALILASKYLQDRNYSARAWSKISGLNTQEINQNEMAFLLAVNWKLHITDDVYNRWTDCVMKHTPSQPPSRGGPAQLRFERECVDFKHIILNLNPGLDNLNEVTLFTSVESTPRSLSMASPRSLLAAAQEKSGAFRYESTEVTPTPKSYATPIIMEPAPSTVYTPGQQAPALGLLPTPRLTPRQSGLLTPTVSNAPYLQGKSSSMGFAMTQAGNVNTATVLDRWPASSTSSPQSYYSTRRSSLANSISTASSPESMVSDASRTSRSSSISSASSLASAPHTKLDVQARCRYAKLCSERYGPKPTITSVPEDYEEDCMTSSPELYAGPMGKDLCELTLVIPMGTSVVKRENDFDDATNDAARVLQQLHNTWHRSVAVQKPVTSVPSAGIKRSRPLSVDNGVQDDVRDILRERRGNWSETLVRPVGSISNTQQVPGLATTQGSHKRVCCSAEAAQPYNFSSSHPAMGGLGGHPGMWAGILN